MYIEDMEIDTSFGKDFEENRPNGLGFWILIIIKTKAKFVINGVNYEVRKPSYLFLQPTTPVHYGPLSGEMCLDWISFHPSEEDAAWMKERGLSFDVPMRLCDGRELATLFQVIKFEHYMADKVHEQIETNLMRVLFLLVLRQTQREEEGPSVLPKNKYPVLNDLRIRIYSNPEKIPSVDTMAKDLNMSRSGLQHLYKKMFGVPISSDVINSRIVYAKKLLGATKYTLKEIAKLCGYQNEFYFMRQFKEVTGMTPSEFRNSL